MNIKRFALSTLLATAGLSVSGFAAASSHREAPSISADPAADNTDLYAWVCNEGTGKALCVVANYIPLELPEGGPNYNKFSDDVLYQVHLTHTDAKGIPSLDDYITLDIQFDSAAIKRVAVDDQKAGPGGGKEFFAQLAGSFAQTATVAMKKRGDAKGRTIFRDVPVAPPNIGQRTSTFVYGNENYEAYSKTFIKTNDRGYKLFAGPRDDAFYVNLGQVFDLGSIVGLNTLNGKPFRSRNLDVDPSQNGQFANTDAKKALDGVAGLNVHSIAFSIPLGELTPSNDGKARDFVNALTGGKPSDASTFGVWASASRRTAQVWDPSTRGNFAHIGGWRQVSRLGLPLINEVIIGVQDKDRYNRTKPTDDVTNFGAYFLNPVLVRDVEAIGGYAQLGIASVPDDFKYGRVDILNVINLKDIPSTGAHNVPIEPGRTGDVLRVDVAIESGFPNGRPLSGAKVASGKEEDVTDVELSLVLAKLTTPITDYVNGPGDGRKLVNYFPYLAPPFAGDVEGKGKPAAF